MVAAAAEFTVTSAVSVTVTVLFTLAVTVFVPASVELKAPVIWPLVLVVPAGCVSVIPVAGFAASVTVAPLTGLPLASFTVTVIVLALDPELAVIVPGEAATSDSVALAPAGFTVTGAVWATLTLPFTMALTVFVPAAVELNEPVICPPAFVVPAGWVSVLPVAGLTTSVTVAPWMGFPLASRTVTVMVLEPTPAVIVAGAAATVDCVALGPPAVAVAVNVTGLPLSPAAVARSVSTLAAVPRVQEFAAAIPFAPVATGVAGSTVPLSPLVANVTATPGTGLANWSRTITEGGVGTAVPTVAASPLPALRAICVAAPAVPVAENVTGLPARPADVAVRLFGPAVVPIVQDVRAATPLAFVRIGVVGLTLPLPTAGVNVTDTPATGLLNWSRTITAGGVVTAVPTVAAGLFPALGAIDVAAAAVTLN